MKTDINVFMESIFLKIGSIKFLGPCEGCGLEAIQKTPEGKILIKKTGKDIWEMYD